MNRLKWVGSFAFLGLVLACVPTKLTPEGANVWLTTQAPYATCRPVAHVEGRPAIGYNDSKTVARNKAARVGANFVHIDEVVDGIVRASAYDCPAIDPAATAVPETTGPREPVLEAKAVPPTPKKEKTAKKKKVSPAAATPTRSAE
jgi:hypothetical protein